MPGRFLAQEPAFFCHHATDEAHCAYKVLRVRALRVDRMTTVFTVFSVF